MRPLKLLLVGATGFVGSRLLENLRPDHDLLAVRSTSPPLPGPDHWMVWDGDPASLGDLVQRLHPRAIVNAAAVSSIVACQKDPATARRVNSELPGFLARAARNVEARIIHLSTDQVFSGRTGGYVEEDPPHPISLYGRTKREGEVQILAAGGNALVLRLNLVCGPSRGSRPSADDRMLHRARQGQPIFS